MRSQILFVSRSAPDARRLSRMLHALPVVLDHADSVQTARAKLRQDSYEVVLTEAYLPDGGWMDVLQLARESAVEPEVIVTDAHADARFWSEVLNLGAFDLVAQPFHEPEVRRILYNACSRAHAPVHHHAVAAV
jgi:two-component system response regulator PilR (NtrC family)